MNAGWKTNPDLHKANLAERYPGWCELAKFLSILLMAAVFFLLAQSMEHHRFHEGGRLHHDGSIGR